MTLRDTGIGLTIRNYFLDPTLLAYRQIDVIGSTIRKIGGAVTVSVTVQKLSFLTIFHELVNYRLIPMDLSQQNGSGNEVDAPMEPM